MQGEGFAHGHAAAVADGHADGDGLFLVVVDFLPGFEFEGAVHDFETRVADVVGVVFADAAVAQGEFADAGAVFAFHQFVGREGEVVVVEAGHPLRRAHVGGEGFAVARSHLVGRGDGEGDAVHFVIVKALSFFQAQHVAVDFETVVIDGVGEAVALVRVNGFEGADFGLIFVAVDDEWIEGDVGRRVVLVANRHGGVAGGAFFLPGGVGVGDFDGDFLAFFCLGQGVGGFVRPFDFHAVGIPAVAGHGFGWHFNADVAVQFAVVAVIDFGSEGLPRLGDTLDVHGALEVVGADGVAAGLAVDDVAAVEVVIADGNAGGRMHGPVAQLYAVLVVVGVLFGHVVFLTYGVVADGAAFDADVEDANVVILDDVVFEGNIFHRRAAAVHVVRGNDAVAVAAEGVAAQFHVADLFVFVRLDVDAGARVGAVGVLEDGVEDFDALAVGNGDALAAVVIGVHLIEGDVLGLNVAAAALADVEAVAPVFF